MPAILWLAALPATPLRARASTTALTKQKRRCSRAAKNCAKPGKPTPLDPREPTSHCLIDVIGKVFFPYQCAGRRAKFRPKIPPFRKSATHRDFKNSMMASCSGRFNFSNCLTMCPPLRTGITARSAFSTWRRSYLKLGWRRMPRVL
jgi:hypothetical protein